MFDVIHYGVQRMFVEYVTEVITQCKHCLAKKPALVQKCHYELVLKKRFEILCR